MAGVVAEWQFEIQLCHSFCEERGGRNVICGKPSSCYAKNAEEALAGERKHHPKMYIFSKIFGNLQKNLKCG